MDNLPLNQRNALLRWLAYENLTYTQAADRLLVEYQVKASASAIGGFYRRTLSRRAQERAVQIHLNEYAPALHAALNPIRKHKRKRKYVPRTQRSSSI